MVTRNSWNSENPAQVSMGGTGLATITDHSVMVGSAATAVTPIAMNTNGMLLIGSAGADPVAAVLTAGAGISVTNAAGAITVTNTAGALTNPVIQKVSANTTAVVTCTTALPEDDTIPQITEGNEVLTCAITPTNASNILEILLTSSGHNNNAAGGNTAALFQDATAGVLAAECLSSANGALMNQTLRYRMVAGTTSATTFRIRIGNSSGGHVNINGSSDARLYGGVAATYLTITEYKV